MRSKFTLEMSKHETFGSIHLINLLWSGWPLLVCYTPFSILAGPSTNKDDPLQIR